MREALSKGTKQAILSLGKTDGFMSNASARIGLPAPMDKLAPKLRKFGLGGALDAFDLSINRAAEAAVPQAADIFSAAIEALTIEDAMGILNGPDDAATRYFETKTSQSLAQRMRPLITQATDAAGVTSAYKNVSSQAGPWMAMLAPGTQDLDGYVTDKTLKGLFTVLASEEQKIRQDPAARSTELLKQVFGKK